MLGWKKSINVWDGLCEAKTDAGIDIGKSGGDYIGEGCSWIINYWFSLSHHFIDLLLIINTCL